MSLFSLKKQSSENIRPIDRADAISQLMIFLEYYHVDLVEMATKNSNNKKISANEELADFLDADKIGIQLCEPIEAGFLTIQEENSAPVLIQHLYNPIGDITYIKYGSVTGKVRRAIAGGANERLGMDIASEVCFQTKEVLNKLTGVDGKNFEMIANAFFRLV